MGVILGSDATLSLPAFIQSHGGMIDYNGDGRVDMGDLLGLFTFLMSPQALSAGLPFDGSAFAAGPVNPFQTMGLNYFFANNISQGVAPDGSMNWMLHQLSDSDVSGIPQNDIFGASFLGLDGVGSSLATIISTFLVFQFVNDFVDNGVAPEWYSMIVDGELSSGTSTFNDFLSAVYPDWTTWSSQNSGITFEDSTQYSNIYQTLSELLPTEEALLNYAAYYVQLGIDINQQFVVSAGTSLDVIVGGSSLVDGLWEDLSSYSSQDFVVNAVSNNSALFASFDVNQDGEYGFADNVAVTLIVALLMEYFAASPGATEEFLELNIAEILFDLAENHATYTVMPFGGYGTEGILSNINDAEMFGGSTNVREALNYLLDEVLGLDVEIIADSPNSATPEQVADALSGMVTSVVLSLYTTLGVGVTEVSPGVIDLGDLSNSLNQVLSSSLQEAFVTFIENADNNAILQTLFENTDGSYYVDADGNEIPFSFTAAGLQALTGSLGNQNNFYYFNNYPEALEDLQDAVQALDEAGLSIDFNGDGVYDMNDLNILVSIATDGPVTEAQAEIAEILNVTLGNGDSEGFDLADVLFFANYFGLNTTEGDPFLIVSEDISSIDSDLGQAVSPYVSANMFGYFNDDGTWVDFGYDDLTPDDYFGPGWSATQTNNNETTS